MNRMSHAHERLCGAWKTGTRDEGGQSQNIRDVGFASRHFKVSLSPERVSIG